MPKLGDTLMRVAVGGLICMTGYGIFATTTSLYALKQFNKKYNNEAKRLQEEQERKRERS